MSGEIYFFVFGNVIAFLLNVWVLYRHLKILNYAKNAQAKGYSLVFLINTAICSVSLIQILNGNWVLKQYSFTIFCMAVAFFGHLHVGRRVVYAYVSDGIWVKIYSMHSKTWSNLDLKGKPFKDDYSLVFFEGLSYIFGLFMSFVFYVSLPILFLLGVLSLIQYFW